ncbi:MAG TPA: hypothetical protein VLE03_00735 [Nitrospiraceae bacterium]|nr:hypothetical protein [Nitrospiraceae bacterium]
MPVEVGAGAEVGGIDIRLFKVVRPPAVRIRGKVTGVPPDSQISVLLEADEGFFGSGASTVVTAPDYAFDLSAPPGHYTISGSEYSGTSEAYGSVRVTVTGDVTGIVLPMSPAPVISARIRVAEGAVKLNLEGVKVVLTRLSSPVSEIFELRSDAAGRFGSSKPLRPGHYSVVLRSVPEDCFVREIRLGEQEVTPNVFEIVAPGQLEIVLSNTAGKIAGSVADPDGKPFPGSIVTLISADGRSWPSKQAADDAGHFHFTGLRPSKYSLFAWEEVADDLWQDPEFCKKHEDRAIEITVAPGETQNAQLRVIAAEEMK